MKQPHLILVLTGLTLVLGLGLACAPAGQDSRDARPGVTSSNDRPMDPRVLAVAKNFLCPCGGCGEMELSECRCDMPGGAQEAHRMIADRLGRGLGVEETTSVLAAQFGTLKATALIDSSPASSTALIRTYSDDGAPAR